MFFVLAFDGLHYEIAMFGPESKAKLEAELVELHGFFVGLKQGSAKVRSHIADYYIKQSMFFLEYLVQHLAPCISLVEVHIIDFLHLAHSIHTGSRSTAAIFTAGLIVCTAWHQLPGADPRSKILVCFWMTLCFSSIYNSLKEARLRKLYVCAFLTYSSLTWLRNHAFLPCEKR